MYNLVKRQAEVEILPMALSENIGVVCYNPIGGGLLSGKYLNSQATEPARFRQDAMYESRYREAWMHASAKQFYEFAEENGYHPVSLAVAWVLYHPAITAPIVGARNVTQLEDSLNSMKVSMTPELYEKVSDLSPKPAPSDDRTEDPDARKKK
jgi:aryl-alcohol dehydrogenase-like predicted oxidoreductase